MLSSHFDMKDLGDASVVLGIQIFRDRSRGVLGLSQKGYIEKILKRFNMHTCSPCAAPIQKGVNSLILNVLKMIMKLPKWKESHMHLLLVV